MNFEEHCLEVARTELSKMDVSKSVPTFFGIPITLLSKEELIQLVSYLIKQQQDVSAQHIMDLDILLPKNF